MTITARLFARYRAEAGVAELLLDLPDDTTVRDAARAVERQARIVLRGAMCAVNERYSDPDARLGDGDRVAFLPPVSGG